VRRSAAFSVACLLAACTTPQEAVRETNTTHTAARSLETIPAGTVCRVGPDGGPVVVTDRGIGGTGTPEATPLIVDRGIGGTGIVGVITGFASVCVDGLEVAYDGSSVVDIDGTPASTADLRVGQIVAIQARESAVTPVAKTISVRRQVTGRIEAIELGSGTLTVAGQPVSVPAGTWGADTVRLGDWVAVSGLHQVDGMLVASRLDLAAPGTLEVRGQVVGEGATARIGELALTGAEAANLKDGAYVLVSGQYAAGHAHVRAVTQDPLFTSPAAFFGASVRNLVVQGYVRVANGAVHMNGLKATAGPGVNGQNDADGLAIVSLERKPDGTFTAVGLRYTGHAGPAPATNHAPGPASRADPMPPPQLRRSASAMAELTGSGSGSPSGGRPETTASKVTASKVIESSGSVGSSLTSDVSIPTPAPIITPANTAPPTQNQSPLIPPPANALPPPIIEGGPPAQGLTSSNTSPRGATAIVKVTSLHRAASVVHFVGSSSISASTVSLATTAASSTQPAATSVKTPVAVLAPVKTGRTKPTGTGAGSTVLGDDQPRSH
jgi:hypothetical protein